MHNYGDRLEQFEGVGVGITTLLRVGTLNRSPEWRGWVQGHLQHLPLPWTLRFGTGKRQGYANVRRHRVLHKDEDQSPTIVRCICS